ncbi:hypothetical protein ACHAXS_004639 [Conticribra weissflogii]
MMYDSHKLNSAARSGAFAILGAFRHAPVDVITFGADVSKSIRLGNALVLIGPSQFLRTARRGIGKEFDGKIAGASSAGGIRGCRVAILGAFFSLGGVVHVV